MNIDFKPKGLKTEILLSGDIFIIYCVTPGRGLQSSALFTDEYSLRPWEKILSVVWGIVRPKFAKPTRFK